MNDLVSQVDVVVDASPGDVGDQNLALYKEIGKKAVFQGGEEHESNRPLIRGSV